MTTRVTEAAMASVVRDILKRCPNKSATFAELRDLIPKHIKLSRADRSKSPSRPGEELWEQILRNLVSHKHRGFVRVEGGLRLQWQRGPKAHRSVKARAKVHAHADATA